ncbi:ribose 5-phosphate isomerase B [bacterium]
MKIFIGSDHAGFDLKAKIIERLKNIEHEVVDEGTYSRSSCDYPDIAKKVANNILNNKLARGILICGTGIGMSIAANRIKGVRASLCMTPNMAEITRAHNDSNILCLGARLINQEVAFEIVNKWLITPYEGGRHDRRLEKIEE